jgi:hypothetical protein
VEFSDIVFFQGFAWTLRDNYARNAFESLLCADCRSQPFWELVLPAVLLSIDSLTQPKLLRNKLQFTQYQLWNLCKAQFPVFELRQRTDDIEYRSFLTFPKRLLADASKWCSKPAVDLSSNTQRTARYLISNTIPSKCIDNLPQEIEQGSGCSSDSISQSKRMSDERVRKFCSTSPRTFRQRSLVSFF